MNWLDLHMHSSVSMDGEFTPEELVLKAKEAGVQVMAICDHNVTEGVAAGVEAAKKEGMVSVPGVELDTCCEGKNFHIIGYGIDPNHPEIIGFGEEVRAHKRANGTARMQKMHDMGFFFDDDEVWKVCRKGHIIIPDVFEVIFRDHRNDGNPLVEEYRTHDMPGVDFYWKYCAKPGTPGFIPEGNLPAEYGIKCIKAAGGIPVLAHPGANMGKNADIFRALVELGIEGVECYCSYHTNGEDIFYKELAGKYGLFYTQGSDYHGRLKPQIAPGSINSGEEELIYKNLMKKLGW